MTAAGLHIAIAPALPLWTVALFGLLALTVLALGIFARARGTTLRTIAAAALWLTLLNPSLVSERREARPDVAVVVVDQTPSMQIGDRRQQVQSALDQLTRRLATMAGLEVRIVPLTGSVVGPTTGSEDGSRLFSALERALADVPRQRLAGVVALTDGQIHDVPNPPSGNQLTAPFHALIAGHRNEADRRLVVARAPAYGLVGKPVTITVRVEDTAAVPGQTVGLTLRRDGAGEQRVTVPVGRDTDITLTLDHGGQTVIELEVEPGANPLSLDNKRAVIAINGVRDRLRVLLVSGEPHAGERTWRSLLKADPSVDLVHFTILRPPEKQDGTPIRELSLIAFPIRELFELKLDEFDLIIFDRYQRQGILPRIYLSNIADYVQKGGALLDAAGPPYATGLSLYRSPLGQVLPAEPNGVVFEEGFKPKLTDVGHRHPVTADLPGAGMGTDLPDWGRWFRHIDADPHRGEVVMQGIGQRPILVLDRVGKGRVAQLLSDHIWLWTRGYEGGGPQAELLRRLAHWLMKEPELEENDLKAQVVGNRLQITRRSLKPDDRPVEVTKPDGEVASVPMTDDPSGRAVGSLTVERPGLYRLSDGTLTTVAAVGALNPLEFSDMRATETKLAPIAAATGGGVEWLADGLPDIRRIRPGRQAAGRGWIGLKANGDFMVTGVDEVPLLPAFLVLAIALGTLMLAWRREGR
ncbi:MAG: hypothetical protein HYR63_22370 [Proteobacteria bacterium]|nr:hypothetical protein [Pseudomonadota bacterium]MBI3497594.1 hypothetical protein [Pseudomonadota bacterium]